jgi:transposase-like protein
MSTTPYRGFRFPKAIIQHAIWLYLRWVARFGPLIAGRLRRRRG